MEDSDVPTPARDRVTVETTISIDTSDLDHVRMSWLLTALETMKASEIHVSAYWDQITFRCGKGEEEKFVSAIESLLEGEEF